MRRLSALALLLSGCLAARPKLIRELHNEQEEVRSSESAELLYRAHTPELKSLLGIPRDELQESLGPGVCVPHDAGKRCTWGFSTPPQPGEKPLLLQVDFDAKNDCTAANWAEAE